MTAIDAVYADGAFRPLTAVDLPENQRVRLSVEVPPDHKQAVADWLAAAAALREQIAAHVGILPDCTADIAADRRRDG